MLHNPTSTRNKLTSDKGFALKTRDANTAALC